MLRAQNIKFGLEQKVALITGGASGIGRATAVAFAAAGAGIVIADVREQPISGGPSTAEIIQQSGGKALFLKTDVAVKSQVETLVDRAVQELGRIDILVNNAGIGHASSVEHTPDQVLRRLMEINFYGAVYGIQAVLPVMHAQGGGHIINISSGAAMFGLPYASVYAASKAAMMRFSESLRYELEGSDIKVSVIYPDYTATDLATEVTPGADMATRTVRGLNQEGVKKYGRPVARLRSPEEVAQAILACALRPRGEVFLSRRIRFQGLFRCLFPATIEREARLTKKSLEEFLDKVAKGDSKTAGTSASENSRMADS